MNRNFLRPLCYLILLSAAILPTAAQPSGMTPLSAVNASLIGQDVNIQGSVVKYTKPWKETAPHIARINDGTGEADVVFWDDVFQQVAGKDTLGVGSQLQVVGKVDQYRDNLQVQPAAATDIHIMSAGVPPAATAPDNAEITDAVSILLGELSEDKVGQAVSFSGNVVDVTPPTSERAPYKVTINDGTGDATVVFWKDFYDQLPPGDQPQPGQMFRVEGRVDVFQDQLQVQPGAPADFRNSASSGGGNFASSPVPTSPFASTGAAVPPPSPFNSPAPAPSAFAAVSPAPPNPFQDQTSGSPSPSPFDTPATTSASPFATDGAASAASPSPFSGSSSPAAASPSPFAGSGGSPSAAPSPFGSSAPPAAVPPSPFGSTSPSAAPPSPFAGGAAAAPSAPTSAAPPSPFATAAAAPAAAPSPMNPFQGGAGAAAPVPFGQQPPAAAPASNAGGAPPSPFAGLGSSAAPAAAATPAPFGVYPSPAAAPVASVPMPFVPVSAPPAVAPAAQPATPSPFTAPVVEMAPAPPQVVASAGPKPAAAPMAATAQADFTSIRDILPEDEDKTRSIAGKVIGAFESDHGTLLKVDDGTGRIDVFLMKRAVDDLSTANRALLHQGNSLALEARVKVYKGRPELRISQAEGVLGVPPK